MINVMCVELICLESHILRVPEAAARSGLSLTISAEHFHMLFSYRMVIEGQALFYLLSTSFSEIC